MTDPSNLTLEAKAADAAILAKLKRWAFGSSGPGATLGHVGRDPRSPSTWQAYYPAQATSVSVSGQARVDQTVHMDVHVDVEPGLRARIDAAAGAATEFEVPLIGGGTGRIDSDATPHRRGGIGRM